MKRKVSTSLMLGVALCVVMAGVVWAGGPTQTWNFNNLEFVWDQDYPGWGPALTFGEDVHVHYEALTGNNVRLSGDGDLSWVLTQNGTATITALDDGAVLHEGHFTVVERAIDVGNDAGCQVAAGNAWIGKCASLYSNVEFVDYTWMIDGGTVYYYNLTIDAPGQYCFTIGKGGRQDTDQLGPGCNFDGGAGFDEFGYNYGARIFVGTADGVDRNLDGTVWGDPTYANDMLVMKWSKAWDDARFHGAAWTTDAWCDNEWNGMFPGGSGSVWHYKTIWVGPELQNSPYWREGGYPIWGQFEVIMDHGLDPSMGPGHIWFAHANPTGYGAN